MQLTTESFLEQQKLWPQRGKHILAQFDNDSGIVYQAYKPSIATYAIQHQQLGGSEFSYARMSWIKPNFLWMMFRSGWGSKPYQEATLALRLRRSFFDEIIASAVPSSFDPTTNATKEEWQSAVAGSEVRLQWDPDHAPDGSPVGRRAIQLGLRGKMLERLGRTELLEVIDLTSFIAEQRACLVDLSKLRTPRERVYPFDRI